MKELEEKIKTFPTKPGVYKMKDREGKVIYVGKAVNLRSRVRSYFGKAKEHLLTQSEKDAAESYVLDNCDEVEPFVKYLTLSFSICPFNKFK